MSSVLAETNRHYTRHFLPRLSGSLLGLGLFTSEGRLWSHERRLVQPAFHREHAKHWCVVMAESAERAVDGWADGEVRDTHNDMVAVALENVSRTLFGADVHTDIEIVARALQVVMGNFESRLEMLVPPPHWVPTPGNVRLAKVIRQLDGILYRFVNERRASGKSRGDVLDVLLEAQARDSSIMSDRQIRDEAMARKATIDCDLGGHPIRRGTLVIISQWVLHRDERFFDHPGAGHDPPASQASAGSRAGSDPATYDHAATEEWPAHGGAEAMTLGAGISWAILSAYNTASMVPADRPAAPVA